METNLTLRRGADRGKANHGWLDSNFTFSFADYYDPAHMGFRSLRVINDDRIAPLGGFPKHPHRDMEIFSYLLEGRLAHEDSMGNKRVLEPGQVQLMSAGSGVLHSEFNPSDKDRAHLLQIWIQPRQRNLTPSYTEWQPQPEQVNAPKVLVISPDGRDHSATIHQDVDVWRILLQPGESTRHELAAGRGMWFHAVRGTGSLRGVALTGGDAASTETPGIYEISAGDEPLEALLFDLA